MHTLIMILYLQILSYSNALNLHQVEENFMAPMHRGIRIESAQRIRATLLESVIELLFPGAVAREGGQMRHEAPRLQVKPVVPEPFQIILRRISEAARAREADFLVGAVPAVHGGIPVIEHDSRAEVRNVSFAFEVTV